MNKRTFWQLLKNYRVIIPIIQRDYAQGRKGKEFIRKNFLEQIMKGLFAINKKCEMDFVYGTVKDGALYPIDGQQRLTTLWLFHWYVAWKEGKFQDDLVKDTLKDNLKKFSYETRTSSREFCEKLCDFSVVPSEKSGSVVDAIENETWFYSEWKQDPTIQSMCRMLRGTCKTDHNGKPDGSKGNFDGIEEVFNSALWILHWYIAWYDRKGVEEETLNKYSCVLRDSLQKFCKELCEHSDLNCVSCNLVSEIQKRDWFSEWKQDTSVQSMLSLLQEIIKITEESSPIACGTLREKTNADSIFEKLIDENSPLQFSLLEIGTNELPMSDDLYIKMNARGKALTSFENFKADLLDYIHVQAETELLDGIYVQEQDCTYQTWIELDNPQNGLGQKMDNAWTDIFWKYKSSKNSIDEIYFSFLNRFFFNEFCMTRDESQKYILKDERDVKYRSFGNFCG